MKKIYIKTTDVFDKGTNEEYIKKCVRVARKLNVYVDFISLKDTHVLYLAGPKMDLFKYYVKSYDLKTDGIKGIFRTINMLFTI